MDLMSAQQRVTGASSGVKAADGLVSATPDVTSSSDNTFHEALASALGLESNADTDSGTSSNGHQENFLAAKGAQTPGESEVLRQDMPLDGSVLPQAAIATILPAMVVAATPAATAFDVMENAAENVTQADMVLLADGMFMSAPMTVAANQTPQVTPSLSPAVATSAAQVIPGVLAMRELTMMPSALPVTSPVFNGVAVGVTLADAGKMINNTLPQSYPAVAALGDSFSQPTPGVLNLASSTSITPNSSGITGGPLINIPLGANGWGQELGNRVQWMVTQNIQAAELRINPPHLGPIEIRIAMDQDQANISFSAPHLITRDALEASIPRLRDMLNDNGLNLANVNVSAHSFADQRGQQPGSSAMDRTFLRNMDNVLEAEQPGNARASAIHNLVDYYA